MEPARCVEPGFFPLDEELGLGARSLTPLQHEHLVHLASWMPFARAAQMLERLLGVQVSEATVRRLTQEAGAQAQAVQRAESQQAKEEEEEPIEGCARQVISCDGAYVPLIHGQWAEVRTVAIGEVKTLCTAEGKPNVQVDHLSYFSQMTDASTFADLAEGEMRRRGVGRAKAVCAVTDGADWLQGFVDLHRPDALRLLDFPHAAEHLSALLEALQQAGGKVPVNALERGLHLLKHRGPRPLLRLLDRLPAAYAERDGIREHLLYLRKREAMMHSPSYQRQGWPIGSGMVESANKVVVQARLKGAGMHWAPRHVNPMLALRNAVWNDRWQETWHAVMQEHRQTCLLQRQHRATPRLAHLFASWLTWLVRFRAPAPLPAPCPPRPADPPATLPGSSRPSAHHPWKRPFLVPSKRLAKI